MEKTTIEKTYTERAMSMNREARLVHIAAAAEALKNAMASADGIRGLEMTALNELRVAGIAFNNASGHEQLIFSLDGNEFVRREIMPHLPEGCTMAHVKTAVKVASMMPKPITTREELRNIKPLIQVAMVGLELEEAPRRKELQTAHGRNLFSDYVRGALALNVLLKNLDAEEPMTTWPAAKLDEFIENSKPVKLRIEQAERLRLGLNPDLYTQAEKALGREI